MAGPGAAAGSAAIPAGSASQPERAAAAAMASVASYESLVHAVSGALVSGGRPGLGRGLRGGGDTGGTAGSERGALRGRPRALPVAAAGGCRAGCGALRLLRTRQGKSSAPNPSPQGGSGGVEVAKCGGTIGAAGKAARRGKQEKALEVVLSSS